MSRPDVGARFAEYSGASSSGFSFSTANAVLLSLGFVTLEILQRDGTQTSIDVQLAREQVDAPPPDDAVLPAASANAVTIHCDRARLYSDGLLSVQGWAVAQGGINAIEVWMDGTHLGETVTGKPRPDVEAAFPTLPCAGTSGFEFSASCPDPSSGEHRVVLRAHSPEGARGELAVAVSVEPDSAEVVAEKAALIRMHIDSPAVSEGLITDTITDRLTLAGWAIARRGLKSVVVYLNDACLGNAYLGVRRQDIEQAFPDWPNSLRSGFGFNVPRKVLRTGTHTLRVSATDEGGLTQDVSLALTVEKTESQDAEALRRKVPFAETQAYADLLHKRGKQVDFLVVIPVRDVDGFSGLRATINSLKLQTYDAFRVLLIHELRGNRVNALRQASASVGQVIGNGMSIRHRSRAGKLAQSLSPAETLVALMNPGDELAVDALMHMALECSTWPTHSHGLIYVDELKLDNSVGKIRPFFKPDWSPDLLLSTNYVGTGWAASANLVSSIFPELSAFSFATEYDRALRLTERASFIRHVPRVLARRAARAESASSERAALRKAAERSGTKGSVVNGFVAGTYRFKRSLFRQEKVSIIIPTIAAGGLIRSCIDSIRRKSTYADYEIIILDNRRAPDRKWQTWFKRNADIVLPIKEDFNWSRFNNVGARSASGEYFLFLNDDIEVIEPAWIEALIEHAQRAEVGAVGPQLLYPDGKVQHAGLFLARNGAARHAFRFADKEDAGYFGLARTQRNVIGVTGACMMVRRGVFDLLGGFEESHEVINNDVDFCLRCRKHGLRIIYTPYAQLYHHELASRANLPDEYDANRFTDDWEDVFGNGDPFFNLNLSPDSDDYSRDPEPVREIYAGYPLFSRKNIQRILAVKLDHIGDFVTALPALRRLKATFPNASLAALVGPSVAPLAKAQPVIDEVLTFSFFHHRSGLGRTEVTDRDLASLARVLNANQFDLAVDLRKHPDTREILRLSGAPICAGYDSGNKFPWLDVAMEWERDHSLESKRSHVATDLVNLIAMIENACEEDRTVLTIASGAEDSDLNLPPEVFARPVVCVHPAAGNALRQWPARYFAKLVDLFVARPVNVVVIGGPDEAELVERMLSDVRDRTKVWSAVGQLTLSELPRLLGRSSLFVGNNSGPQHMAAGMGVPTVAIHSAVIASEEWGPLGPCAVALRCDTGCGPCYLAKREDCFREVACLTQINPYRVFDCCTRFLPALTSSLPFDNDTHEQYA